MEHDTKLIQLHKKEEDEKKHFTKKYEKHHTILKTGGTEAKNAACLLEAVRLF